MNRVLTLMAPLPVQAGKSKMSPTGWNFQARQKLHLSAARVLFFCKLRSCFCKNTSENTCFQRCPVDSEKRYCYREAPNSFNSKFKCKSAFTVYTVQYLIAANASISKTMFLREQECDTLTCGFPWEHAITWTGLFDVTLAPVPVQLFY